MFAVLPKALLNCTCSEFPELIQCFSTNIILRIFPSAHSYLITPSQTSQPNPFLAGWSFLLRSPLRQQASEQPGPGERRVSQPNGKWTSEKPAGGHLAESSRGGRAGGGEYEGKPDLSFIHPQIPKIPSILCVLDSGLGMKSQR